MIAATLLTAFICRADLSGPPHAGPERPGLQAGPDRPGLQAPAEKIAEIRVHGNATLSDDVVLKLAGVTVGAPLDAGGTDAIEKRLKDSGRFDEVQVRKRYRTLEMDEVALVLLVHERPGVSATGEPPSMARRIRNRLMFFPILHLRRRLWVDVWGADRGGQRVGQGHATGGAVVMGRDQGRRPSRPTAPSRPAR